MSKIKEHSTDKRNDIIGIYHKGKGYRAIVKELQFRRSTVRMVILKSVSPLQIGL